MHFNLYLIRSELTRTCNPIELQGLSLMHYTINLESPLYKLYMSSPNKIIKQMVFRQRDKGYLDIYHFYFPMDLYNHR